MKPEIIQQAGRHAKCFAGRQAGEQRQFRRQAGMQIVLQASKQGSAGKQSSTGRQTEIVQQAGKQRVFSREARRDSS